MLVAAIAVLACASMIFMSMDSDAADSDEYKFYLYNTVDGEDSTINGWYTGNGDSVVAAFCNALDEAKISYTGFSAADNSIAFGGVKTISNWSQGAWLSDGSYYGANFAIWNYNSEDGWHLGNYFGSACVPASQPAHASDAEDRVFIISHEMYVDVDGAAAPNLGISNKGVWPAASDYDIEYDGITGGYANADAAIIAYYKETYGVGDEAEYGLSLAEGSEDYDDIEEATIFWMMDIDVTAYSAISGWDVSNAQYGYAQLAPQDVNATPENLKFGPTEYRFLLQNSVAGENSDINGWYSGYGATSVEALYNALTIAKVPNKIDPAAESVWFASGTIADWSYAWNSTEEDCLGANYAVWNYNAVDGWHLGNSFGEACTPSYQPEHASGETDTVFLISHENYYVPDGETAQSLGVDVDDEGEITFVPLGLKEAWGMYVQFAPLNVDAVPEDLVFGKIAGVDVFASVESDGKIAYFETLKAANDAADGTLIKVFADITNPASLTLKKDLEVLDGVTLTVAKSITVASGKTLTIDEGATVLLPGGNISNSGTVVINGTLEAARFGITGKGTITGDVTVLPYFAVGDTGTYSAGAGTTVHEAGQDKAKYADKAKVTLTYTVTSVPGAGESGWTNYGTATVTDIKFEDNATIAYIPSFIVAKVSVGADVIYTYYKVTALSDDVVSAINGKTVRLFLPSVLQSTEFGSTVDCSNNTYYVDTDGNKVYYHVDETTSIWMNGNAAYTMYTNVVGGDPRFCEQGTVIGIAYAEGKDTYSKKMVNWSKGDAVCSDEYISGSYADMLGSVIVAENVKEYTFIFSNSVDGEDSSINGTYTAYADTPVRALSIALDAAGIPNTIDANAESVWFVTGSIADWSTAWDQSSYELIGPQYAVWNYDAVKGWFIGNTFGMDSETTYLISHENYYSWMGETAFENGIFYDEDFNFYAPAGILVDEYGWYQKAPQDLKATPKDLVFGPAEIKEYNFYLLNTVDGEDSDINGWYTGYGTNAVQALKQILTYMEIENNIDFNADFITFGKDSISDWSVDWDSTSDELIGPQYAIWNYDAVKGWFTGNTFGMDSETTYLISHENYYSWMGETAFENGIFYDEDFNFYAPAGILVDEYGWYQKAPQDLKAVPENLVFGPAEIREYNIYLLNSVEGADSDINGWYTGYGTNAVQALKQILTYMEIENDLDYNATSVFFRTGNISDWATTWDSSADDLLGANIAVWNYSEEKGWFTGNTFGMDPETTYLISHENYYVLDGETSKRLGISSNIAGDYFAPAGISVNLYGWIQKAPVDLNAPVEKLEFGLDESTLATYTFILNNSVAGADSKVNGTYTGIGTTAVQALVYALNNAGIKHNLDYNAASVYFKSNDISDWATSWDSSSDDIFGANIAVWNYDSEKGWFLGNTFGKDSETVYLISHENYYAPAGKHAKAIGVVAKGETYEAPAGIVVSWNSYVQLAPMDLMAAPADLVFEAYYFITFDTVGGSEIDMIAKKAGEKVTAPAEPSRSGFNFLMWEPALPETMSAEDISIKAIWATVPVVTETEVVVDLTDNDTFVAPETNGKELLVELPSNSSVVIADAKDLVGKVVTSSIETVENPSKIKGSAFEFTFEADGKAYNGLMQVTVPFKVDGGKVPAVYFVNGSESVEMKVISFTKDSVTFETNHNSTYVVAESAPEYEHSDLDLAATIAIAVAAILAAVVAVVASVKKKE